MSAKTQRREEERKTKADLAEARRKNLEQGRADVSLEGDLPMDL